MKYVVRKVLSKLKYAFSMGTPRSKHSPIMACGELKTLEFVVIQKIYLPPIKLSFYQHGHHLSSQMFHPSTFNLSQRFGLQL